MSNPRARRSLIYLAVAVVGAIILLIPPVTMLSHKDAFGLDYSTRLFLRIVACTAAMAWTTGFATVSFHYAEEFKQQGSMFAWYWGGAIGLAVAAPIYVFIALGGLGMIWHAPPMPAPYAIAATRAFMLGFALPVICQLVGFIAVRAWWVASKR